MPDARRLSDDGTGRYKAKIALFVLAATLGIAGLLLARRPTGIVEGALLIAIVIGCAAWSLRSTVWFMADSVDLAGRRLNVKRGRRTVTIDLADVTDVARAGWSHPGAIVLGLRSPVEGFGHTVTYLMAGADAATSADETAAVAQLRNEIGLMPVSELEAPLTPERRSRLKLKRWFAGLIVLLCAPILVNSILDLNMFAPYDRKVMALAMVVLFVVVYFGFSQGEWDAISDSRRRARK